MTLLISTIFFCFPSTLQLAPKQSIAPCTRVTFNHHVLVRSEFFASVIRGRPYRTSDHLPAHRWPSTCSCGLSRFQYLFPPQRHNVTVRTDNYLTGSVKLSLAVTAFSGCLLLATLFYGADRFYAKHRVYSSIFLYWAAFSLHCAVTYSKLSAQAAFSVVHKACNPAFSSLWRLHKFVQVVGLTSFLDAT